MCSTSCANSSGTPIRLGNGTIDVSPSFIVSGTNPKIGVSKLPGAIVITRMPSTPRSRAIGSVMPTTPPFDAE